MKESERIAQEHGQMSVLLERVVDAINSGTGLHKGSGLMMAIETVVDKVKYPPIMLEPDDGKEG